MMHPRLPLWLLALPLAVSLAGANRPEPPSDAPTFTEVPGEREFSGRLIVRPVPREAWIEDGWSVADAEARVARAHAELAEYSLVRYVPQTDDSILLVPEGMTENELADRLRSLGVFQYAEPDWILYPIACPDDSGFSNQWHHAANIMRSCDGWDLHTGLPSVSVGICDTGVRTTHEDFQLHRLEGYNAVDRQWESQGGAIGPVHPHGTMCTGCAAGNGNNSVGVSGVGWDLSHRMLRVSNSSGGGAYMSDLQHAAQTAVEAGDRVASVSYSGVDSSSNLTTATYIKSIGGLLVWAAGNDGRNLTFGNRDADDIIVAGATDSADAIAYFSAYGPFVDVVAPGVSVYTTDADNDTDYAAVSGTSFACPLTAGLCALIWSANPSLTPDDVELVLKSACHDLGAPGVDNTFGYGRIETYMSMVLAGAGGTPPTADFVGTPTSGFAPLTVDFTDSSTGTISDWAWDFGDTGSSTDQHPSYTYLAAGTYTVALTVSGGAGGDTLTRTDYIVVDEPPPVAGFTGFPTTGVAPLTVDFTDTSTGAISGWDWDFGDAATSTAQHPSHIYTAPGTYSVVLAVVGPGGADSLTRTDYIVVDEPPPVGDFAGFPTAGVAPLTVDFTDASTGAIAGWDWDFGDAGTSSAQDPSYTYTTAGTYSVSLTVTGPGGADTLTRTDYIVVDEPPPAAAFDAMPTSGAAPLDVAFTDLSTGAITGWTWDFGDGGSAIEQHPSYTYLSPGTYTVSLTVLGPGGTDTATQVDLIVVQIAASSTIRNGTGVNPLVYDSTTLPILGASWDAEIDGTTLGATGNSFLVGYGGPWSGFTVAQGELLLDPSSGMLFTSFQSLVAGVAHYFHALPADPIYAGFPVYTQGYLFNVGGKGQLTNAVDLVLGH